MRKGISLLLAVMVMLLCGCTAGELNRYPFISQEQTPPRTRLTLVVGQEEWLFALGSQLSEVVADLSGGAVSLQVVPAENAAETVAAGQGDLCFVSSGQLTEADPGLSFLQLPFLFATPEDALACLNGEDSPVAASALAQERYGSFIGGYYDSGWCIAVNTHTANDLLRWGRFGVDQRFGDRECYLALGADETATGDTKRLIQLLSEGELAAVEMLPQKAPMVQEELALCLSRHRIEAQLLFIRQGAAGEEAVQCLRQAFNETVTQAAAQRMQLEQEQLEAWGGEILSEETAGSAFEQAMYFYRWQGMAWGLPEGFADRWCIG